jgi:hypothetical protein
MIGRRRVRLGDGTPVRRYVCDTGHGGCGKVGLLADPVETMVAEWVVAALDGLKLGAMVEDRAAAEVAEITAQMDDLADLFASRQMTRAQFQRANERLVADLAEAEARAASETRRGAVGALAGHLGEAWPTMSLDQRRAVIGEVVEAVIIAERTSPNRFDAGRVSVVWKL